MKARLLPFSSQHQLTGGYATFSTRALANENSLAKLPAEVGLQLFDCLEDRDFVSLAGVSTKTRDWAKLYVQNKQGCTQFLNVIV